MKVELYLCKVKTIKGIFIREYLKRRVDGIINYAENAESDQLNCLKSLVDRAKNTEFGRTYRFEQFRDYTDFEKNVPVSDYDQLKPYFEKMLKGQQNILWPDEIKWFSKSSGTTQDKSKFIPVSYEALSVNHYRGAYDITSMYVHNKPDTRVFEGKTLILGGSLQDHQPGSAIKSGDVSAIMIYNQPFLADVIRTPSKSVTLMADFEKKLALTAKIAVKEHVTAFAGVPTWNLLLLQKIIEQQNVRHIGDVWPEMELYIHGGVSFTPYKNTFEQLIPLKGMEYLQTYNASEGFLAFQDRLGADDMLLATKHGIFFEFIPQGHFNDPFPKAIPLSSVQVGIQYAVVITTNAGLWRYKIGDTVVFTSIRPFRIKVSGRTKFFINAFGEEVIVENTDAAISEVCTAFNVSVKDYSVAPVYFSEGSKACHEWMIEFENPPQNMDAFSELLDLKLQQINSDYEAKRSKNLALINLKIHIARKGLFYDWLKEKGKIGAQIKVPRLSNDRKIMEELLKMNVESSK